LKYENLKEGENVERERGREKECKREREREREKERERERRDGKIFDIVCVVVWNI